MRLIPFLLLFASQAIYAQGIKVLTFNVFALPDPFQKKATSERMEKICEKLSRSDYDVVLIQEAWFKKYRKPFKRCGFSHVMDQKHFMGAAQETFGSGLLILSKHPILQSKRYILPRPRGLRAKFKHGEGFAWKSLYLAQILYRGSKIWIANTHLVANYCDDESRIGCVSYEEMRRRQLEIIAGILEEETNGSPVIFGGDLNMGDMPVSRDLVWNEIPALFPGFTQAAAGMASSTSSPSNLFKIGGTDNGKIDHLFGSSHFEASAGRVVMQETFKDSKGVERQFSDHFGWESTFNFL